MSFPNVIYGRYGDEKVAQSTAIGSLPYGQLMILPDGRKARHALAPSGTAIVAGSFYQCPADVADTAREKALALAATVAVGATSVVVTMGGTALTADQYVGGYLITASSAGTGVGRLYKILTNNSAAASSTATFGLEPSDPIETALSGGTTTIGIRQNQYRNLIVTSADTAQTGPNAGVAPVAASAGFSFWVMRSGPVAAHVDAGTAVTAGNPVTASSATAGALGLAVGTAVYKARDIVGHVMTVPAADQFAIVNLELE